jgi:hypothetical protein
VVTDRYLWQLLVVEEHTSTVWLPVQVEACKKIAEQEVAWEGLRLEVVLYKHLAVEQPLEEEVVSHKQPVVEQQQLEVKQTGCKCPSIQA